MLSQGAFCQEVWYSSDTKVLESPALHIETRNRSLITENNFWLISKWSSDRDPIIHFLWSVSRFKSFFFSHKNVIRIHWLYRVPFPVFQVFPQPLPSQKGFLGVNYLKMLLPRFLSHQLVCFLQGLLWSATSLLVCFFIYIVNCLRFS